MKTFKQFIAEDDIDSYENRMTAGLGMNWTPYGGGRFGGGGSKSNKKVYRVDDKKIENFNKNLSTYASNKTGTESGKFSDPSQIPAGWRTQTGLYGATKKADVVGYVFPRGTRNTTVSRNNKTTMVIDKKPPENHNPTLSTFDKTPDWEYSSKNIFGRPKHSEVFSTNPPKPTSQETITNPIQFAKDQGVRVIVGDPNRYRSRVDNIIQSKGPIEKIFARRKLQISGEQ